MANIIFNYFVYEKECSIKTFQVAVPIPIIVADFVLLRDCYIKDNDLIFKKIFYSLKNKNIKNKEFRRLYASVKFFYKFFSFTFIYLKKYNKIHDKIKKEDYSLVLEHNNFVRILIAFKIKYIRLVFFIKDNDLDKVI